MYAIIEACGKQYKVVEGDTVFFEKLDTEVGKKVTIGENTIKGAKVEATVIGHGKAKKILVFKYKAKKNERTKQGHRQPYTKVEITGIKLPTAKAEKEETVAEKKPAKKTATKKEETK